MNPFHFVKAGNLKMFSDQTLRNNIFASTGIYAGIEINARDILPHLQTTIRY
jgi:hypothetical protein